MSQWLNELIEKNKGCPKNEPTKLTKAPFVGFVSMGSKDSEKFQALKLWLRILEEKYDACQTMPQRTEHDDWLEQKRQDALKRIKQEMVDVKEQLSRL